MDSLSRAETVLCCFSSASHHGTKGAVVGWSEFEDVNSKASFLTTYSQSYSGGEKLYEREGWDKADKTAFIPKF